MPVFLIWIRFRYISIHFVSHTQKPFKKKNNIEERFKYCTGPQANNHVNGYAVMQLDTLNWVASHPARQYKLARSFKRRFVIPTKNCSGWIWCHFWHTRQCLHTSSHPVGSLTSPSLSICEAKLQSARWRSCGALRCNVNEVCNPMKEMPPPRYSPVGFQGWEYLTPSVQVEL